MSSSTEERRESAGAVEPDEGDGAAETDEGVGGLKEFFSFGDLIATFRMCEAKNVREFAKVLGVTEEYLVGVEARSVMLSAAEAAEWARVVDYPETEFVRRWLQDFLDEADLGMCVSVEAV